MPDDGTKCIPETDANKKKNNIEERSNTVNKLADFARCHFGAMQFIDYKAEYEYIWKIDVC